MGTQAAFRAVVAAVAALVALPALAAPRIYVANFFSNSITVVNPDTGTIELTVANQSSPKDLAAHPDGTRVYIVRDGGVTALSTLTHGSVGTFSLTSPGHVAVSPSGDLLYVSNACCSIFVFDTATQAQIDEIALPQNAGDVAVSPPGTRLLATTQGDNMVRVFDTATNGLVATIPVGTFPTEIAFNPAGTRAYVSNEASDSVSVINLSTNAVVATIPVGDDPAGIAVKPSGDLLYVANRFGNSVSVIDASSNAVVATVTGVVEPVRLAMHPHGTKVYVSSHFSDVIHTIDTATSSIVATMPAGDMPDEVAFVGCYGGDQDLDGVAFGAESYCDNCPAVPNPDQADADADGKGDACDGDNDNDGCLDTVDQDPTSSSDVIGTLYGPQCDGDPSEPVYGFSGVDTDGDGQLNCEDLDDDNDGNPDESDGCPTMVAPACLWFRDCSRPTIFDVCSFGGACRMFFLRLVASVNPDPTKAVRFEVFETLNGDLFFNPPPGLSLGDTATKFATPQGSGLAEAASTLRLEVWSHATATEPERLKMVLAEYDPRTVLIGDMSSGALLRLILPYKEGEPLRVEAVWSIGADPGPIATDLDRDSVPDPLDNCPADANRDQADQDGDQAGDACDCSPEQGESFSVPAEIAGLRFDSKTRLSWTSGMPGGGFGTTHDVVRGSLDLLPVGDQEASCLGSRLQEVYKEDQAAVPAGSGFWYLVRGRNSCGEGTYGFESGGRERIVEACP